MRSESRERLWLFAYDITDPRRWRHVHRLLEEQGDSVQLSIYRVRATPARADALFAAIARLVDTETDRLLRIDLGSADRPGTAIRTLGRPIEPGPRGPFLL